MSKDLKMLAYTCQSILPIRNEKCWAKPDDGMFKIGEMTILLNVKYSVKPVKQCFMRFEILLSRSAEIILKMHLLIKS